MKSLSLRALLLLPVLVVAAALWWGWKDAASVLVGGVFAAVNWLWMVRGADAMLKGAKGNPQQREVFWYLVRLLLIFGMVFAMIHFSFLSLRGVVLGLAIFILSTMAEALFLLIRGWTGRD